MSDLFSEKEQGRKKNIIWILASFVLLAVAMVFFSGDENKSEIRFSTAPGFYEEPISLKIEQASDYDVYYTLDGTKPTKKSIKYEGEIYLSDATTKDNYYSARDDISAGYRSDLIALYSSEDPGYTVPDYKVDKCNIVRAVAYDKYGKRIGEISGSYFIGDFLEKDAYQNTYTANIITDPDNLFGYEKGIYVLGKRFDERLKTLGAGENGDDPYWWWWDNNSRAAGESPRSTEREAHIEIYNNKGQLILNSEGAIRISGNGSRGKLPKSLSVLARPEYSGDNFFDTDIFSGNPKPDKFKFFSGADDNIFKLYDYMVNSLEKEMNFSTMEFFPCQLFLEGEYWGTYYITEAYNANYVKAHYGVDASNTIIVKNNEITEGKDGDIARWENMRAFISENDMTNPDNYKRALELIDIDSYIDYYAAQIYIARSNDWPLGNYAAWRTKDVDESNPYADGRWRWMLFDVNSGALKLELAEYDALADVLLRDEVFASLFENEEFKETFVSRLYYVAEEIYSPSKYNSFLDQYLEQMSGAIYASNLRFYNDDKKAETLENADKLREFFDKRNQYFTDMIEKNVGEEYLK